MNLGHLVVRFFVNSGNLICRSTGISMYFRESLGVRDNESRLYMLSKCSTLSELKQISSVNCEELLVCPPYIFFSAKKNGNVFL